MIHELRNAVWPISDSNLYGVQETKHRIEATSIVDPYKITVPTYGNKYFYTDNYKGKYVNIYE
jgi:hypothetical protein